MRTLDFIYMIIITIIYPLSFVIFKNWLLHKVQKSVDHKYDIKLEQVKKELSFELERDKKLYDGKLQQYKKYYKILDSYNSKARKSVTEDSIKLMTDIISDPTPENTQKLIAESMNNIYKINEPLLEMKNEISGLKLEAGSILLELLKKYEIAYEENLNKTQSAIKIIPQIISDTLKSSTNGNIDYNPLILKMSKQFNTEKILDLQEQIFYQMRAELGIK